MRSLTIGLALGLSLLAPAAHAVVIPAGSPAALGANDQVAWNQLGAAGILLPTPVFPVSAGGVVVDVSTPAGEIARRDQGVDWFGGFPPGTPLLFDQHESEPLQLTFFSTGVFGVGAEIEESVARAFTATLTLFGPNPTTVLGSVSVAGGDGPVFLGALSDTPIARVRFETAGPGGAIDAGFAIGPLALRVLPEPASGLLLLAGLGGLVALRRRAIAATA